LNTAGFLAKLPFNVARERTLKPQIKFTPWAWQILRQRTSCSCSSGGTKIILIARTRFLLLLLSLLITFILFVYWVYLYMAMCLVFRVSWMFACEHFFGFAVEVIIMA